MIIMCAFEMSVVVAYITRFTEENFAFLIAAIYVYKAVEKIFHLVEEYPLNPPAPKVNGTDCFCEPYNTLNNSGSLNWIGQTKQSCAEVFYNHFTVLFLFILKIFSLRIDLEWYVSR